MTAPTLNVQVMGRIAWKLVFEYDNSNNTGSIVHSYSVQKTTSYKQSTFVWALNKHTARYIEENRIAFEAGASYVPLSAKVANQYHHSAEINTVLEMASETRTQQEETTTETETRSFTIGPNSRLSLYQQYFSAPGVHQDYNVFSTWEGRMNEVVDVAIDVEVRPIRFIADIKVHYGGQRSEQPADRVRELGGGNDDINAGFGGEYVWLVPAYTYNPAHAATRFDLIVQSGAAPWDDLAKGAGGEFRYLRPVVLPHSPHRITELVLLRAGTGMGLDPAWGYHGMTEDINKDRKGDFLYLLWKYAPNKVN